MAVEHVNVKRNALVCHYYGVFAARYSGEDGA